MRFGPETKVYVGLLLALAMLAALGLLAYQSIHELRRTAEWESHSFEVLYRLQEVRAASNDLDAGRRGYLLTGQERYLAPYRNGLPRLHAGLEELARLTRDNAEQQQRLAEMIPLAGARELLLEESIALKQTQPNELALQDDITERSKRIHDRMRDIIAEIETEERRLLHERTVSADASARAAQTWIVIVNLAAVLLFGVAAWMIRKDLLVQRRAEAALQRAYHELGLQLESRGTEVHQAIEQVRHEIQRRNQIEQALLVSEQKTATILQTVIDGIITIDEAGRILSFNPAAERIFGYQAEEVLGQNVKMLMPPPYHQEHDGYLTAYRNGGARKVIGIGREAHARRKDGSIFSVDLAISEGRIGTTRIFTGVIRDITERKRAEGALYESNRHLHRALAELQQRREEASAMTQQLWQAAKLATVGELAAGIAHELNNPLATVSLRVESLLAQTSAEDPKRRLLEVIDQETERMGRLVANLLHFSRRGQDEVSSVNVHDELIKALDLIDHQLQRRKIGVVKDFASQLPLVFADRQKVRQVFLNLFTNAADAMLQGGTLTLRTRLAKLPGGLPGVSIEVSDTGVGIAADNLRKVWEPFFTTKEEGKGTGLGLAICRRIVQEHGGTIEIDSTPGSGTTVSVLLPVTNGKRRDI